MFSNIGWPELMVIAVVAIVFVGPKDLPGMLRTFGRFSRKVRGIAGDFQRQVDEALRESELDDVRKSLNDVRSLDPRKKIADTLNPLKDDIEADLDRSDEERFDPEKELKRVTASADEGSADRSENLKQQAADNAAASRSDAEPAKFAKSGANAVPGFDDGAATDTEKRDETAGSKVEA